MAEEQGCAAFVVLNLSKVKWCHGHRYVGGFVRSAVLHDHCGADARGAATRGEYCSNKGSPCRLRPGGEAGR